MQQFIDGKSLQKELETQGVWTVEKVTQFLKEILPVLQFIHEKSVIHRDIKPDNLMRRSDTGQIVLIDFGLSKSLKGSVLALPGTRAGSYGYVPLEQMEGGEAYPASDLFSLGVTCFHLLSGIHPHSLWVRQGYGWVKNWQSHISQPLPPALIRVLDKLLREEYTRRYQSAQEVLKRLNAPGDNTPGQPLPRPVQPIPVPPVKTRPTVVAVPPQPIKRPNPPVKTTPSPQNQSLPAADWQMPLLWLVALGGSYGLVSIYQVGQEALIAGVFSDPDNVSEATLLTRILLTWLGGGLSWDFSPAPPQKNRMRLYPLWLGLGLGLWLRLGLWLGLGLFSVPNC